jgi:cytochrome c5
MKKFNILIGVLFIAGTMPVLSQTEPWKISAEEAKAVNPVGILPKNLGVGRNAFNRLCAPCHGAKADGQGLIQSTSLITDTFQKQTDGALYYKLITGRNKMPPFKGVLKEEDLWSVINYLRVLVNPSAIPPPKAVQISLAAQQGFKTVNAMVVTADSLKIPIHEADVHFYIQRDFGLMRIGELSNYTGPDGKAMAGFPDKVIGDDKGNVTVIARIENDFLYTDAEAKLLVNWGAPLVTQDEQFNRRSLWGSRSKSPVWLLLLANGIIAGVWGVIIYILFNLFRIKKAGRIFLK